jgi:citronellol/citronellal dehydrogenase
MVIQAKIFIAQLLILFTASAISLTDTVDTPLKKYDLMNTINARGTWLVSKYAIPHLKKSSNPHILTMSPPLSFDPKWYKDHVAYTISK